MHKKLVFIVVIGVLISLVFVSCNMMGGRLSKEEQVKKRLNELFEICKSGDFSKADEYLVYRGKDKDRKWKDVYDYSNANERTRVDNTCRRIKRDLDVYGPYEITKYTVKSESEGEWNILEVTFKDGDGSGKRLFAFLKIKGNWALGDID
ncbi:hypothetical protein KAU33_06195 [Candidatus Dependentiae bacterium]|nr:hypothetical protein [Candidatus Dependentiae bacterium]